MKKLSSEDKVGLYITIIVHLSIIIILLLTQIGFSFKKEDSFVMDFSRQELEEKNEKEKAEKETFDEIIADKVNALIAGSSGIGFKNIATDRNAALKDDRNTDVKKLYEDAERLSKELKSGIVEDEKT